MEDIQGIGEPVTAGPFNSNLMVIECIGYTPLNFWSWSKWIVTNGFDDHTDAAITIKDVKFFLKELKTK